jgi:hypothetical protein
MKIKSPSRTPTLPVPLPARGARGEGIGTSRQPPGCGAAKLVLVLAAAISGAARWPAAAAEGVYVRFKLVEPAGTQYYVRLGGFIHQSPWYLPPAVVPAGADSQPAKRIAAGGFTPWFDLKKHAGDRLHGRMSRAGGVAELPNVTADFLTQPESDRRTVVIELATAADEKHVVKRFHESFRGSLTSFLVSPRLIEDAGQLETASQMTARRLRWARQASGTTAVSPRQLIVQTSFWSPQRKELNLQEAEVLRLLGFNVVGGQTPEVQAEFHFRVPGHSHEVDFSPAATREQIDLSMKAQASRFQGELLPGVPFGFSDEVTCGLIGENPQALRSFHRWLEQRKVVPDDLGVSELQQVVPIETPDALKRRQEQNRAAANRVFYLTSRFRQEATTQRFKWLSESFHKHFGPGPLTSTLVADHPYFSGTGLGMGMGPNPAWGRPALAADWFDMARKQAVDLAGIEDWMGLQYMYGPDFTWEGFQLMGFQAAMFRSGSGGTLPIIAWITPSDETNLRLKTASALCQGAKHFFYWTYGPTCTSTENYWSDLRGAYDGIVHVTRQLAAAEHVIAPGKTRRTRLALLYGISSDLWQPFGYVHMLERRGTYLSLIHDQYLVDMLTEEDVQAGRLRDYDVLYVTDPCIAQAAAARIKSWVAAGGHLFGSTAAGSRNEFNEEVDGLSDVFGIKPAVEVQVQPGQYHVRGALNAMQYLDYIGLDGTPGGRAGRRRSLSAPGPATLDKPPLAPSLGATATSGTLRFGAIGTKVRFTPTGGAVAGTFADGSPAAVRHDYGRGSAFYVGTCPAIAYIKEAKFVPRELKERWSRPERRLINSMARRRGVPRLVELSHAVVEAGVYDAPKGTALVLANFTYQPIEDLRVRLFVPGPVRSVTSVERGKLRFSSQPATRDGFPPGYPQAVTFTLNLGLSDVVVLE